VGARIRRTSNEPGHPQRVPLQVKTLVITPMQSPTNTALQNSEHNLNKRNLGAIAGVLLSRLLGVARTVIINAYFGANTALDAFNAAARFPNSLRDLFADGALSAAFTKAFIDAKPLGVEKEKELIAITAGFFLIVTLLVAVIAAVFAEPFIRLMSDPEFITHGGLATASELFRWLAFFLPLTMLNAIVMAILGVEGLTFRAMNGSLFVSIGMVAGTLALGLFLTDPIYGLTWGMMVGAIFQLVYQAIPILGKIPLPNMNPLIWFHFKPLRDILKMMAPRALGQGASVLALMVNTYFALTLGSGVMTFVATTIIIIQVPIGLFGVATGFASLPVLTDAINQHDYKRFSSLLTQSLNTSLWLAAFTTAGFALLIVPFYIVVFQHGKIDFSDTLQNALCICAYSSGIIFGAGGKILMNTLYALNATRQIVWNSLVYLFVSALLCAILVPNFGIIGLGLAFGIASAANYWLNYAFVYAAYQKFNPKVSPYQSAGSWYWLGNSAYTLLAFVFSIGGIYLTTYGWQFFTIFTGIPLTTLNAGLILLAAGVVLVILWVGLTYLIGPKHLQRLLRRSRQL
jgi:putative peptidoglycan lipid II flippase